MTVRRTGIDLSSARCTVVDTETATRRRAQDESPVVRIHQFATLDADSAQALAAELKLLVEVRKFSRHAWVTLWGVRNTHQYTLLPAERQKNAEEVASQYGASVLGVDEHQINIGVWRGPAPHTGGCQKIELSFFAASAEDIQRKLRPIQEAGFVVDGVVTPCGALWAQARIKRPALPGQVHAYFALGVSTSALIFVKDGVLLYARELNWGFAESLIGPPTPHAREYLASLVAGELRRSSLYVSQFCDEDVSQLLLCGDMPEIRSLTAPLIERLNIEVETLDTLDGIDTENLPEPVDQFLETTASMRLASAVAMAPPPVNLMSSEITAARARHVAQAMLALGSAAAIALAAYVTYDMAMRRPGGTTQEIAPAENPVARSRPQTASPDPERDRAARNSPSQRVTPVAPAASVEPQSASRQPQTTSIQSQKTSLQSRTTPLQSRTAPAASAAPQSSTVREKMVAAPAFGPAERDPVVGGILYSSQHQVALVDGRIVRPGDPVGTSIVTAIDQDSVVLKTATGQVKRLALNEPHIKSVPQ